MYSVGIALVVVWVGLAILVAVQMSLRPIGAAERALVNALLATRIDRPSPRLEMPELERGGRTRLGAWARRLVNDTHSWRVLVWLVARVLMGPLGFVVALLGALVPIALTASLLLAAMYKLNLPTPFEFGADQVYALQVMDVVTFWVLMGAVIIVPLIPSFAWMVRGSAALTAMLAKWSLGPTPDEALVRATERAELAETQVRIDQELHDSIGHMITMNVVQAGAGAHVFDTDPEFARQALRNIEQRGRVAMGELDRIIAAIRGDDDEPRAPLPVIEDLPALMDQSRAAGIKIDERLEAGPAPATLSRAAYAIVREGLTNAAKHSPGAIVHVHTATLADAVAICVRNAPTPKGTAPLTSVRKERPGMGHGIAGIRDRAALLGGASRTGRTADGGYEVMVLLALEIALDPSIGHSDDADCCRWGRVRATVVP